MVLTIEERELLTQVLGVEGLTIILDRGFSGLKHTGKDLSGFKIEDLYQVYQGCMIGYGMAMADAKVMMTRAAEINREIVCRTLTKESGQDPPRRPEIKPQAVHKIKGGRVKHVESGRVLTYAEAFQEFGCDPAGIRQAVSIGCRSKGQHWQHADVDQNPV